MKRILITCLFGFLPAVSQAASFIPIFNGAFEFGGDKLVDVVYSDGSRSDIEAGRGILLAGGAVYPFIETASHQFEAQATIGVKWTNTKQATNGEVTFTRWPIELLGFYRNTEYSFRVGTGLTYQLGNELKGTGVAAAASTKLKNTAGFVVQGEYIFGKGNEMGIGLRYTSIRYEPENFATSANGSSFGVDFTYFWY